LIYAIQKGTIATLQKLQSKLCRNLSNEHVSIDNGVFSIFQSLIVEIHMCKSRTHIIFCDQTGILLSICPGLLQGGLKDKCATDHPNLSQICGELDKSMFGKVAVVLENHSLVLMLERPHGYYHSNIYLTKKELFTAINIDCTVAHYVR